MIVVSDAGLLIHLGAIGRLELVHRLWSDVLVPEAVFREVTVTGAGLLGAEEVKSARWLTVASPSNTDVVTALLASGLQWVCRSLPPPPWGRPARGYWPAVSTWLWVIDVVPTKLPF